MAASPNVGQGLSLYEAARQIGVPFTQENRPTDKDILVHGMNFHYLEWGDSANPKILMLHGNSQQSHSWDFISLSLSDRYNVIALDQRGHGDSDWAAAGDYSLEAQVGDLDGFVKALGLDQFVLMGHSMGGAGTVRLGFENAERFAAVATIAGYGSVEDLAKAPEMPLFMAQGGEDALVPVESARAFYEAAQELGMANLEYVENPGTGHVGIVAEVMAQAFDWFDSHSG